MKYEITQLRKEAVARLTFEFPSTLEQWDNVSTEMMRLITRENGIVFDIIQLARQHDLLAVLPAAFYTIVAEYGMEEVMAPSGPTTHLLFFLLMIRRHSSRDGGSSSTCSNPSTECYVQTMP
jgi:hypothetical protein